MLMFTYLFHLGWFFFFFLHIYLFIFGHVGPQLQHVGSFIAAAPQYVGS